MSEFIVSGRFEVSSGWQQFDKTLEAENEDVATERVLSQIGSQHGLRRTQIEIGEVQRASDSRTQSDGEEVKPA